ncbi:MAG: EFR1 family ferrodoxin [Desulfobacterales bacterium]|nr:MAG: EFR1 family ferrodoxin [Desulfobacterales bacterium]
MDDLIYKKAVFYVMSGTGNTYRVSRWIEETVNRDKTETKVVMIEDADFNKDFNHSNDLLLGLLFPTHGFMPPWSMIKFLFRIPKRSDLPVMCVATRGALKIGSLHIPGASGFAAFFAAIVMFLKGYRVKAIFSLDMPSNFINFHWGLHPKNVDKISKRSQHRLKLLIPRIFNGQRILFTRNNLWEILWCVLLLWLVPLLPIAYLIIARMFMAKVMFSNNDCVGCGMCARNCPNNAILMKKIGSKKHPYWTYHCENCLRCMGYCKKKAVEAGHSWAVLLYFITSIPIISFVWVWLHEALNFFPVKSGYLTIEAVYVFNFLLYIVYFLSAVFLSYWIFWYLIRFPFFNSFFSLTTLTHYYRRYHQPETKVKHLVSKKNKSADARDSSVNRKAAMPS